MAVYLSESRGMRNLTISVMHNTEKLIKASTLPWTPVLVSKVSLSIFGTG